MCLPRICCCAQPPSHELENEHACSCLNVIDLDYPKQARDVIDELAEEVRQVLDMIRTEQNDHYLMQDEDRAIDLKIHAELRM